MSPAVALRLGRVSNLPTVWSNLLAALLVAGSGWLPGQLAALLLAFSLYYVGGMYLNDACDHAIDRVERPERPIPSGQASLRGVALAGSAMLLLGGGLLGMIACRHGACWQGGAAAVALAAAILLYDLWHKGNPFSPVIMGGCRALVYLAVPLALVGRVPTPVAVGAGAVWSYVIGLTYIARQENLARVGSLWPMLFLLAPFVVLILGSGVWRWPAAALLAGLIGYALWRLQQPGRGNIPRAVGLLIAGISLVDGLMLAAFVPGDWWLLGAAGFLVTRQFQRYVPGT